MLTLENLSLFYEQDKKILDCINLTVADGECILLTGESGSGKSSIINSINGLAFEYENAKISGSLKVDNRELKGMELYEISLLISSVFQNPKTHFFNVDTTLELLFYLENIGLSKQEMESRIEDMLKLFPIKHLLGRSIFELSGGEKQILCVAACYISGCKIIVLDEPSSNLDDIYIDILKEMLQILKNKGITLIIAEHRIYYLTDLADRIILVRKGELFKELTKDELLNSESKLGLRSAIKTVLKAQSKTVGNDLNIKKLEYKFKEGSGLKIDDISFGLGNIYGITGKNGCGKSTFIRVMTGLDDKGKSEIIFNGKILNKKDRLKNSSLVMQDVNHQLFTDSVEEEIKLGVKDLSQDRLDKVLYGLELTEFKDRHPMSLSGGQKQRVAIASVLCKNSKFIFFDEPTSGLDYASMKVVAENIKNFKEEKDLILIISHDYEFLEEVCDEVIYFS